MFDTINKKYLDFTSFFVQAQHITRTGPFACRSVEAGSLVV